MADKPPENVPIVVRIRPLAYLRSMLAILWGAFRHPFKYTLVDLTTGKSFHLTAEEYRAWLRQTGS